MELLDVAWQNFKLGWWLAVIWLVFYNGMQYLTIDRAKHLPDNWITWIDSKIPMFEPGMDILYMSSFVLVVYPYLGMREPEHFTVVAVAYGINMAITFACFTLYPVKMKRPPAKFWVMKIVQATDKSCNCIPSLHASMALLPFFAAFSYGGWEWPIVGLWALGINVSTVFTKQHYVVDLVVGFVVAIIAWSIAWVIFG